MFQKKTPNHRKLRPFGPPSQGTNLGSSAKAFERIPPLVKATSCSKMFKDQTTSGHVVTVAVKRGMTLPNPLLADAVSISGYIAVGAMVAKCCTDMHGLSSTRLSPLGTSMQ